MKIATWNVNSLRVRLDHVRDWLKSAEPDVLGLQETKLTDDKFPIAEFEALGYHCAFSGQPTYNGVALISREPATDVVTSLDGFEDPQRRVLGVTVAGVRVLNLYVPNGQSVDSDKYEYKLGWLTALTAQLRSDLDRYEHVVRMCTILLPGRARFCAVPRNVPRYRVLWSSALPIPSDSSTRPRTASVGGTIVRRGSAAIGACEST